MIKIHRAIKLIRYDHRVSVVVLAVICCLLWGTAFPVLKISFRELQIEGHDFYSKMVFAGMRFFISGVLVFLYYLYKTKKIPDLNRSNIKGFFVFGMLNTTLQYFFFYTGVANTTAIKGVLLDSSKPLFVVIMAHFLYKNDRINWKKMLGLLMGFTGIFIVNIGKIGGGLALNFTFLGEGYLILSSLASSLAVFYGKRLSKVYEPIVMNCYQFIFGSLVLLFVGLIGAGGFNLRFNWVSGSLLIYSAFLSATAFVIWFNLLKYNKATSITIYMFLIPIFGAIISSITLVEEHLNIQVIISLVLSATGIYLVNMRRNEDEVECEV